MSDISPINSVANERVEPIAADRAALRAPGEVAGAARPSDRVDISDRARLLSRLAAMPPIRTDLVGSIRRQIADGTYETADRLDTAISSLLEDLDVPS